MSQKKSLGSLCTAENLVRTDYFSDTYNVVMTVDGVKRAMNIMHISIPFRPNREKAVMKYFDISKSNMDKFYQDLSRCIGAQINTSSYLCKHGVKSILRYIKVEIVPKKTGRGNDIYLVTEPLRSIASAYFPGNETNYENIFKFGFALGKILKDMHQLGDAAVTMRVLDMDQMFVSQSGLLVMGSLQYAHNASLEKPPIPLMETAPLHIHGRVSTGSIGDIGTDMYSMASVMWSLLNGDGYDKPTPTGIPPKYATPEMTATLELGLTADPEMFPQFRKKINEIYNQIKKENLGNGISIPVPMAPPCIDTPTANLDSIYEEVVEEVPFVPTPVEAVPVQEEETKPKREAAILPHGTFKHKAAAYTQVRGPISENSVEEPSGTDTEIQHEENANSSQNEESIVVEKQPDAEKSHVGEGKGNDSVETHRENSAVTAVPDIEAIADVEPVVEADSVLAETEIVSGNRENEYIPIKDSREEDTNTARSETPLDGAILKQVNIDTEKTEKPAEQGDSAIEETDELMFFGGEPVTQTVIRLDDTELLKNTESACDITADPLEVGMNVVILYNNPKFVIKELLVCAAIGLILLALIYTSVQTHLFSLW